MVNMCIKTFSKCAFAKQQVTIMLRFYSYFLQVLNFDFKLIFFMFILISYHAMPCLKLSKKLGKDAKVTGNDDSLSQ